MEITKVCAYFNNIYLDSFSQHCDEILDGGFNTILICVPESIIKWNLNNLFRMVEIAKYKYLKIWLDPWGVGNLFDGESLSEGDPCCICSDRTWDIIVNWTEKVRESKPDVIFWDNPKVKCNKHQKRLLDIIQYSSIFTENFRLGIKNYICLSAINSFDDNDISIFDRISKIGTIDGIGTDPYILTKKVDYNKYVKGYSNIIQNVSTRYDKDGFIWVQGFGLKHGQEHIPIQAGKIALEAGITIIGFWGFRACEGISSISPANASLVWSKACNFFRSI